jgi:hypothetical protein
VEDIIGEIEDTVIADAELLFPSKPGGIVDRHRRERARRAAALAEQENIDQRVEGASFKAVKVAQQAPEVFTALTYTIPAGGSAPVLPLGPYRNRALLLVITSGATVILAKDQGQAISSNGFTLPAGTVLTLTTRAQVYAFNNTGATVQVSVAVESYAPEKQ